MHTHIKASWAPAFAFLFFSAVLLVHSNYYMPFLSDDSLISLRYVNRFLQGYGLTWTDGPRVEGYSNLLWMLLIAGLGALGVDLIEAARILGIAGMSVVILAVLIFYTKTDNASRQVWLPLVVGLGFFCLAVPTAVWAIGGLEQPLFAALLAIAIPLCFKIVESDDLKLKTTLFASLALGLMSITRPDGPIFTVAAVLACVIVWRFSAHKRPAQTLFVLLIFPVLLYAGQTVFRFFYYGELLPNTALVKVAPSLHHTVEGLQYVSDGMLALAPFSLIAVVAMIVSLRVLHLRKKAILLLCMMVVWLAYLVVIGGDSFPAWRHFVPVIVIFTFALIEGTRLGIDYAQEKKGFNRPAFIAGLVILFSVFMAVQLGIKLNKLALQERWEWVGKDVGLLLKNAFSKQQPLIAVTAAGCLPYWSELPAVDMLGLNDYYLPRHPPKDMGTGFVGHELGNGRYVLDRKPDIIIFQVGIPMETFSRSGREMQQTDEFYQSYTPVKIWGTVPFRHLTTLWMRKYSDKIGIRQTPLAIEVPGFLLNANPSTTAYLNGRDELVVSVARGQPVGVDIVNLSQDDWHCEVKADNRQGISCNIERQGLNSRIIVESGNLQPTEIEQLVLSLKPDIRTLR